MPRECQRHENRNLSTCSLSPWSGIMCAQSWQSINTEGGKEGRKEVCMGKIIQNNDSENRAYIAEEVYSVDVMKRKYNFYVGKGILRMSRGNPYLKDLKCVPKGQFYIESFWFSLRCDANHTHITVTCITSHGTKILLSMYLSEPPHMKFLWRARSFLVLP